MWCDASFEGGGWTGLLRRQDGSINFATYQWKMFAAYGVGDQQGEFMISLDLLHQLTSSDKF